MVRNPRPFHIPLNSIFLVLPPLSLEALVNPLPISCGCALLLNAATRPASDRCNACDQRALSLPPETANPNSDSQPQDREHDFTGFHLAHDRAPSSAPDTPDTAVGAVDADPGHTAGPDPAVQQHPVDEDPVERELNHLFQEGYERKKKRLSLKRCNGTKPKRVQPEPQGQQHPASSSNQQRGQTQNR
ncbi:hypothetical protein ACJZ2D_016935 [Fusarium nematophilum]